MALRSTSYLRAVASRLRGYSTSTSPRMQAYAPTADQFGDVHYKPRKKQPAKGEMVPVYVALGMICLSVSLGLYTAKHQVLHSPNVRVNKKKRETIPEVVEPETVVDEADRFLHKSFFRKVAHIQEFENGLNHTHDPIRKDAFAHPHKVETLKSVGIDPKQV